VIFGWYCEVWLERVVKGDQLLEGFIGVEWYIVPEVVVAYESICNRPENVTHCFDLLMIGCVLFYNTSSL
jgi:hypothetical protein